MKCDDIRLMFRYNYWANQRILTQAKEVSPEALYQARGYSWDSLAGTLIHTMDAEYAWRMLLQHETRISESGVADFTDFDAVIARWQEEETAMWAYLDSLSDADMSMTISYSTAQGARERVLWHCLLHVVNHGTQHRSECAVILTEIGHSPGEIDLTVFTLEAGL